MTEETITIWKGQVDTGQAVTSINDLKNNVAELKKRLGDLEIGTEEYSDTLSELKVNQNALKDAMYATSASMEDVTAAATGTNESYNGLVHTMAALKEELRATDVSTEAGKKRFQELASQINKTNDKLKEMDALQGNFQRNVGNYPGLMKTWAGSLDGLDKALKITQGGVGGLKNGFDALSATPVIGTIGIIISLIKPLAASIKESDNATASFKAVLDSMQPVLDFLKSIIEKVAELLSELLSKVAEFITSNGIADKVIKAVAGIGNAIVKFVISPFKAVVAAIKVFKDQGIKGFRDAGKAFADEMKDGVAFKSNFEAGQNFSLAVAKGIKDKKEAVTSAAKEVAEEAVDEVDAMSDVLEYKLKQIREQGAKNLAERKKASEDAKASFADLVDFIDKREGELAAKEKARTEQAVQRKEALIEANFAVADATASVASSIADIYEADEKNSEKHANILKGLRISSAIIDTISGAIAAYSSVWETKGLPESVKAVLAPIRSATVIAAGMAQIAKIRSTKISASSAFSSSSASVPAVATAPAVSADVQQVRSVTSASEEDRLNQMASDQRVYILSSDIEASSNATKVQVAESSF